MFQTKEARAPFLLPLYKVYESNNVFLCQGKVITGPNILLFFLTTTAFCDPGIIPKKSYVDLSLPKGRTAFTTVKINGTVIKNYWCVHCNHFKEPRSKHCYVCNNCVTRFDHHCVWLGNCSLSIKEYQSLTLGSIFYIMFEYPHIALYIIYTVPSSLLLINLFIYHLKMILSNKTTYEDIQGLYVQHNPFNEGKLLNLKKFLFTPVNKG
ncbi:palmitoyltransferase DHHC8 [Plasmodium brasilianum]|uniref:Palmitoyltransferase DHHC8 n=1 Tax=Plasmodium brasilianum TaxID=5824 RepID=A0ACB9Y269_PLABR|nr:palmitoyltransferase DHHC8 [Plasmodium brasilianum]